MKFVCNIEELLQQARGDLDQVAVETGIDPRTIEKIVENTQPWQLKSEQIERLMLLAFERGIRMFTLHHNELWATFDDAGAYLYRGTPLADAKAENHLSAYLEHRGGRPVVKMGTQDPDAIREAMTSTNCVFIGSPRSNPASEVALCLLANPKATPFDERRANRDRLPVLMMGGESIPGRPSAVVVPGRDHGFSVWNAVKERVPIDVDRVGAKEPVTARTPARDAAIVVAARSPLGTEAKVTSLVLMGYSGLATQAAARQLTHGYLPMHEDQLAPGEVHVFSYTFEFIKPKNPSSKSTADLRQEKPESGEWKHLWSSNAARVGALLRDTGRKEP